MKTPLKTYTRHQYAHRAQSTNAIEQTALLYQLLLDDFDQCRGCIERNDLAGRSRHIHHASEVLKALGVLAASIVPEAGQSAEHEMEDTNKLTDLLSEMYSHCLFLISKVISDGDSENNLAPLNEAWSMINHVKISWDELSSSL